MTVFKTLCRSCFYKYRIQSVFSAHVRYFARPSWVLAKRPVSTAKPSVKTRYVYVQTCVDTWEDIPNGVMFDVCYADSHPDADPSAVASLPTILALHSTPGSHEDIVPLLESFVLMGCRVIVPNFPGFGHTEGISREHDIIFTHTNDEKSQFVSDFLENISVQRVDMIIGIGSGCYPLLRLCSSIVTKDMFKSAVFLSPWPLTDDFRLLQPISIHRAVVWLWEHPFFILLGYLLVHARIRLISGFSDYIMKDFVITSYTVCAVDFSEIAGFAVAMSHLKIPKLVLFGEEDEFIASPLVEDLVKMLGLPLDRMVECDKKGVLKYPHGKTEECPSSVIFLHGGKNFYHEHDSVTIALLYKFLKNIRPDIV